MIAMAKRPSFERTCEVLIALRPSLDGARLASSRSDEKKITGAKEEHFIHERFSGSAVALGGNGVLPMPGEGKRHVRRH